MPLMGKKIARWLPIGYLVILVGVIAIFASRGGVTVLHPQGLIADQERTLIVATLLLSLIVVVPVFVMTVLIVWRYRVGNTAARYMPDWGHSKIIESVWWGVPCVIILVLAVIAWQSSHALDPFRPLRTDREPLKIQVVALQWKWLFIYPEQRIAMVNYLRIPVDTPVDFEITADAPMNSFWIPQLGGQIYAMSGMSTHLHLMASQIGKYRGSSANISGRGFAGMSFIAEAGSKTEFDSWIGSVQRDPAVLDYPTYNALTRPSENTPVTYYGSSEQGLYDTILMKYMKPEHGHQLSGGRS